MVPLFNASVSPTLEDGCRLGIPLLPGGLGLRKPLEVLGVWTSQGSQEGCQGLLDCKGLDVSSVVPLWSPCGDGSFHNPRWPRAFALC